MASRSAFAAIQRRETGVTPSRAPVAPAADFIWASLLTRSVMFKDGFQQQLGCFDVGFSDDGSVAVGCMEDASVHVIDHRQGARGCGAGWCVGSLRGHTDPVNHHKFLDSHRLLTASDDTTVLLWDLRCMGGGGDAPSRAMVDSFHGHKNWVKNIELLSSTHFLSSDLGGDIRLWDVRLDGLNTVMLVQWPGEIADGNGRSQFIIDERADEAQRDALVKIMRGDSTAPGATHYYVFNSTMSEVLDPIFAPIEVSVDVDRAAAECPLGTWITCEGSNQVVGCKGLDRALQVHDHWHSRICEVG